MSENETSTEHSEIAQENGAVEGIVPDSRYVENPDHVPNPADITRVYDTTGYGGNNYAKDASATAVGVDRIHTAQQIVDHPEAVMGTPEEVDGIVAKAQAVLDEGYVFGAPTTAEAEAAEEVEPETDEDGNEIPQNDTPGTEEGVVPVTQVITDNFTSTTLTDEGTGSVEVDEDDLRDPEDYVAPDPLAPPVEGTQPTVPGGSTGPEEAGSSNEIVDGETVQTDAEGEPLPEVPSDAANKAETEQIIQGIEDGTVTDGDQVSVDNPEAAEQTGLDSTEGENDNSDDSKPEAAQPAKSASKGDWVDYAVANGWSQEDAEAASKTAIQESFGVS